MRSLRFAAYIFVTAMFIGPFLLLTLAALFGDIRGDILFETFGQFLSFVLSTFFGTLFRGTPGLLLFWFATHFINKRELTSFQKKLLLMLATILVLLVSFGWATILLPKVSVTYFTAYIISILFFPLPDPPDMPAPQEPADQTETNL